ncbi:hypothetical protein [Spirosoma flavum]|uniref:Uncharacterized protein n=1 Tax=Spirosoma flavum TaxID=2048557 RepID=A0ABW6AEC7_9BACT
MNKKVVIILTGTVNPDNMAFTKLQDANVRKSQYIDSIRFWIEVAKVPIVFVENTNTDLSPYFENELYSNSIEILSFNGNDYDKSLGKGYGELNCLEYAYLNSKFIKDSEFIFKVTGRNKLINFSTFLNDYFVQSNVNILVDFKWNLSFCDSRFFGFTTSFLPEYLLPYKNIVDDSKGVFFEHILCKAALTAIAHDYVYKPLITLPRIEGYSGSTGVKYNSNYFHWLRYKYEYILKRRSIGLGNLPWI